MTSADVPSAAIATQAMWVPSGDHAGCRTSVWSGTERARTTASDPSAANAVSVPPSSSTAIRPGAPEMPVA